MEEKGTCEHCSKELVEGSCPVCSVNTEAPAESAEGAAPEAAPEAE